MRSTARNAPDDNPKARNAPFSVTTSGARGSATSPGRLSLRSLTPGVGGGVESLLEALAGRERPLHRWGSGGCDVSMTGSAATISIAGDDTPALSAAEEALEAAIDARRSVDSEGAARRFDRFLALVTDADGEGSQTLEIFCPQARRNGWTTGIAVCDATDPVFAAGQAAQQTQQPATTPAVSIADGNGITEGTDGPTACRRLQCRSWCR